MKKILGKMVPVFAAGVLFVSAMLMFGLNANAYIDPSVMTYVIQAVAGVVIAVGDCAKIGSSGDCAQIGSSGYSAKIGSSGDCAQIGSSGDCAKIKSEGRNAVVMCAGNGSIAKAKNGSWITLAEWKTVNNEWTPVCVKTEYVDGERIKEDAWYQLIEGEFKEVGE